MKTPSYIRHYFLMVILFGGCLTCSRVSGEISLNLSIWHGYDFYYPVLDLSVSNPPPVTYHRVESPNGNIWKNHGSDDTINDFFLTNSLPALLNECTNGLWKLYLNKGDASESLYHFTVSITGVTTNLLGNLEIPFPLDGSVNVTNHPNIQWASTVNLPTVQAQVYNDSGISYFDSLPGTTTNWMPGTLSAGTNTLFLNYVSNNFPGITATTPTNASGPLPNWLAKGDLHTYRFSTFVVGAPLPPNSSGGHTNVARYTFEDETIYTSDESGHGNGISSSASFGGCSNNLAISDESLAGNYAVAFNTDGTHSGGGPCAAWLKPPTNLLATLAGSFTVSLWLKPSAFSGSSGDGIFSAAGLISAFGGDIDRSVVPMAMVGNKMIFYTGGDGGQNNTLYTDSTLDLNDYVHLVVSRNQATGEKKIYVNGLLDASTIASTIRLDAPNAVDIGYHNGRGINATMDEIQIYAGVLSDEEIDTLYNDPDTVIPDTEGGDPIGQAVNAPYLAWTTGGDADWFPQTDITYDGVSAAQSGAITEDQETWVQTTVTGPGTLSFKWKVSSEEDFDFLSFELDSDAQISISGDFDWEHEVITISPGTHTLRWVYRKDSFDSANDDIAWLDQVIYSPETNPLGNAVDAPQYTWSTGGAGSWFRQTEITHDGIDAAQTPGIGLDQESWIQTTVAGPGRLFFWWKLDSEFCSDYIFLTRDGDYIADFYGCGDWREETVEIPPGFHTFRWIYSRGFNASRPAIAGSIPESPGMMANAGVTIPNAAWLDEVSYDSRIEPVITGRSGDITAFTGTNFTLSIQWYGNPSPTFQWFKNSTLLTGKTNETLSINNAVPGDSGSYYVMASNSLGTATSDSIQVNIFDPTDLLPLTLNAPLIVGSQTLVPLSWSVTNTGPGAVEDSVLDYVYLTNSTTFLFVAGRSQFNIPGGTSYAVSTTNRFPGVPAGDYRLALFVDNFRERLETNESNNSLSIPITIINPDLQPGNFQIASNGIGGKSLQVTYNITNNGPAQLDGASWNDQLFLSQDATLDPGDTSLLQPFLNPTIAAGQSVSRTNIVTIPIVPSGDYYVILRLDNSGFATHGNLFETNETNNTAVVPIHITVPDLTPVSIVAAATASTRQPIQVSWSIQNIGDATASRRNAFTFEEWSDRLYLSTNQTVNAASIRMGQFFGTFYSPEDFQWLTPLPAGQTVTNIQTVSIPNVTEGNYFLVLSADINNSVAEINEANNRLAVPILIANPDLVPISLGAPATADSQSTIAVNWQVQNQGAGTAFPNWVDRLYLSTNATYEAQDTLLGSFQRSSLLAASSNYMTTNLVNIPGVAPGNYFVIVRTDAISNLFESITTNNFRATPINVASPDLAVARVEALTNLASQQPITMTFVVTNRGGTTALLPWADRVYFSTNNFYTPGDTPISGNVFATAPLPVGGSYTQEVNVTIPAFPAGNYFLLVATDSTNSFAEVNEGNNVFSTAVEVQNPDLVVSNLLAPDSITITQLNQRVEISWSAFNAGPVSVFPNWQDYLYISPTNVLTTNAIFIGNEAPPRPLDPGQSYLEFNTPSLPNGLQGNYYLLVKVDNNSDVFEPNELNNLIARPIELVIPPLPDLSITSVSSPAQALSGQEIEISWTLTNRGNAYVAAPFREQIYLATSATGAGAVLFANIEVNGPLAPGESALRKHRITLPLNLSGPRWVLVVTDSSNNIFEFNREDNNSLISAQPVNVILSPTPNLSVPFVTSPTNVAFSGQQTLVSWAVTNTGVGATRSPYWYDTIYLSTDAVFGNDTKLANASNPSYLNPGESYVNSATVTLPRGINGTYYILVRTDAGNHVFENADENDNGTVSEPFTITLTPPPDLRVHSMIVPLNAFSGQPTTLSWIVTNSGAGQTIESRWSDRVYLSANTTLDSGDYSLDSFSHTGGLEPRGFYRTTNSVTLPVGITGDWYFLVLADAFNQVYEVPFENNNVSNATTVTSIALTPPPDLETAILHSPTNATSSRALSVTYRVLNNGATFTPNSAWSDRLYISSDANFDPGTDQTLTTVRHYGLLSPGAGYTNTFSIVLPDTLTGTYYLFVNSDANNEVFELDDTNNITFAASTVQIVSRPADLAIHSFQAPSSAEAGAAIQITWAVTNQGVGDTAVARWHDRIVLSADDRLGDADDVRLIDLQHDGLIDSATAYIVSNALITIPITTTPGEYRLFLVTDQFNSVYESSDTNNSSGPLPISIARNTADLQVTNVSFPATAISGTTFSTHWIVRNFGNRPPNSSYWVDSVYLSTDLLLSPSDILLGHRQNAAFLQPGQTYTNSLSATLPPNLNTNYFVIVVTDSGSHVVEAGLEGNNTLIGTPALPISLSPVPDLAVIDVAAPEVGYSGQRFELSWKVQNNGGTGANGTWYDAVFLSLDHFLNPFADYYVGYVAHTGPLAPGQIYTNNASFEIPQGLSGPFFVIVSSDASGNVFERGNRDNNVALDPTAMDIQLTPPVDLVAGPITIPANASPGVNATITYSVFNFGSNTARGSWEDAVYISADTNFDTGDAFFGRARHTGDILPNGGYTNSITAPLPGVIPGDYHVIVRSDILNHIPESDETNNLGATLNSVAVDVEQLTLGTADTGTIDQGQSVFYRFDATAGTTVRIRFTTGISLSGSEIFVRRGQMPTRGTFDFAINEPFVSDPDLLIPIEQTGTYYLLAYASAMPVPSSYNILAEVIPFSMIDSYPAVVGDRGHATLRIRGALFEPGTRFELVKETNVIAAASLTLMNPSTAYATFNLVGATNGPWSLRAFMNETSIVSTTLSNAVTVTSGGGPDVAFGIDGPLSVWAVFTQRILAFYGNSGNNDAAAPLILLEGRDGTTVGSEIHQLTTNTLQLLGRSLDGPSTILRPQSSYSHAAFYRGGGLHVQGRIVPATDLHPITEAEWLDIERSVRPFSTDNATWSAFWSGIRPRIGTTWGDYVRFLHRFAEPFPAEQRAVRQMFTYYITNQPNYIASASLRGTLLGATNNLPFPNVEVGLYSESPGGGSVLGGQGVTDASGQFFIPYLPPGEYVLVASNHRFDMNQDGVPDTNSVTVTVANSDLALTTYLFQAPEPVVTVNDSDATLIKDSLGVLHAFWYRDQGLWHSHYSNGQWIDAAPLGVNVVGGLAAGASPKLIDGQFPGLLVVWSQSLSNSIQLMYSVMKEVSGKYEWARPIQLSRNQAQNTSPALTFREDGLAVVSYLERGTGYQDDSDAYYALVNVASGDLMWNAGREGLEAITAQKAPIPATLSFGYTFERNYDLLSYGLTLGLQIAAEGGVNGCGASAKSSVGVTAKIDAPNAALSFGGAMDGTYNWVINPDACSWEFTQASANINAMIHFDQKNAVSRVLQAAPVPFLQAGGRLIDSATDFLRRKGILLENTVGIGAQFSLNGLTWTQEPAPLTSFRAPDSITSADLTLDANIVVSARTLGKNQELIPDINAVFTPTNGAGGGSYEASGTVTAKLVFQVYPEFKFKSAGASGEIKVSYPPWWSFSIPFEGTQVTGSRPDPANSDPVGLPEGLLFNYDPSIFVGTTNVHNAGAVLSTVATDLYQDGAPSLATDGANIPYQVWYKAGNPYAAQPGSQVYAASFNGTNWDAPVVIPSSLGFNSYVSAVTDSANRRMAVWVHADASSITTNSSATEFFAALDASQLVYSIFDGVNWSAPAQVAATPGPDADLNLSHQANGDILAIWTYTDDSGLAHLVSSRWNGLSWTSPGEIASGTIALPSAQQIEGVTHLFWSKVVGTNNNVRQESLFESVHIAGSWQSAILFEPVLREAPRQKGELADTASRADNDFQAIQIVTKPQEDACCMCKGRLSGKTNGPPTECGVVFSRYDYENCKKIYEYKACPRVSFDPNDIVGPDGFGPERFVGVTSPLNYVIHFENDPLLANAPAKEVVITLPLDSDFDPRTFRLGNFGFGDLSVTVPPGRAFYSTRLDLTATKGFFVDFFAGVDVAKQEAFWRLTTIDPATGGLPIDPLLGFLPVNTTKPEGEGFVAFSLLPGTTTTQGARVDAKATIVFDTQPPIDTPSIFNTIETSIPTSAVAALPAITTQPNFLLSWAGSDGVGGSGIASYNIYVSEDAGPYTLLFEDTTLTVSPFSGEFDTTYAFYSVARDYAGNVESAPTTPDTVTFVANPNTPPVLLNFTNAMIIEETLFTRQIEATDTNVPTNSLTFELLSGPLGMSLNAASGILSWTPTEAQGPTNALVVIKVSDDGAPILSATNQFSITVLETNSPPVFLGSSVFAVDESTNLTFTNIVVDADIPTNQITLQLVSAPDGVAFDPLTGVATWTPTEAQGPSTNEIVVQAKDNGVPVFKILRTNTVVVREVNNAPVLGIVTNRTILPLSTLAIALQAEDSDTPTNQLTFHLGTDVTVPATVDPQSGAFRWRTTLNDAGTSNLLSVVVTDNGTPSLSATQHFVVVVENFISVAMGSTTLRVGETSGVPIEAISSAPWKTLNFTLQLPEGVFDQLALSNATPFTASSISAVDATHSLLTFSNAPGHALQGTQLLAQLTFRAPGPKSAFVPLVPENIVGLRTNEQLFPVAFYEPGRVVVVGSQPLLDALKPAGNQHFLTLFGNPGMTYQIDTSLHMNAPIPWTFFSEVTLTNVSQQVGGVINPPPNLFYRVRQPE